ncbi:MAG TPA: cupin domain-containing protein [Bryobacteraceae bacterium]|jgi:glc operon protein GlcG
MKRLLFSLCLGAAVAFVVAAAGSQPAVTFVDHQKVAASLAKGGDLVKAPDLIVLGAHRNGAGQVEVHDQETDVMYVVDGEATIVTGGTMVGGKVTGPGQSRGKEIQGGKAQRLSKGDVMVIPAGIPHWFKEVPQSISYYVVKVLKQ